MLDIGLVRPPAIILFDWNNDLDAELSFAKKGYALVYLFGWGLRN